MSHVSGLAAEALVLAVRGYQTALSPLMGGACRFEPSCSNYMIGALRTHGAFKGLLLGIWRILRCHPFGAHGYDPVPPKGAWTVSRGRGGANGADFVAADGKLGAVASPPKYGKIPPSSAKGPGCQS